MPTRSVTVRIPQDLYDKIAERAEEENRTVSNMIICILSREFISKEARVAGKSIFDLLKPAQELADQAKEDAKKKMSDFIVRNIDLTT